MMRLCSLLLPLLLLIFTTTAQAGVGIIYSSEREQHFSIEIPDSWQVNVGFEADPTLMPEGEQPLSRIVTAIPNDGAYMWFGMWIPVGVTNFDEAQQYMESLDITILTDVVPGPRRSEPINGMPTIHFQGTGKKDKDPMEYHGLYLQLNEETIVIAMYIGDSAATKTHGDALVQMMQTLRPVK